MTAPVRRLLLLIGIGITMLVVNAISSDLYLILVLISILVLPIIVWTVFGVLFWLSRQAPDIKSLSDAVDDMLTLAIGSTVASLIAALTLLRLTGFITQPIGPLLTVGLGYIIVLVSIPALTRLKTVRNVWFPMVVIHRAKKSALPANGDVALVGDGDPRRVIHVDDVIASAGTPVDQGDLDPVDVNRPAAPATEGRS